MSLAADLLKKINKKFDPQSWVSLRYRTHDVALQTDEEGNAVRMFIGRLKDDGVIKGERYSRVLVRDREGRIIKDHWDRKGKTA
jgi:hypothetical protein